MKIHFNELKFRILSDSTDLSSFHCGDPEIDDFLQNDAKDYQKDRLATTYLVYHQDRLVGFFSLAAGCIIASVVESDRPGFQPLKYPAVKIAQLATIREFQGRDIGKHMLTVVFAVALNLSQYLGCRVVIVDAKKNQAALNLYLKYGNFKSFGKGEEKTVPLFRDLKKIETDATINSELTRFDTI